MTSTTTPASVLGQIKREFRPLKQVCRFAYGDALKSEDRRDGNVKVYGSNGSIGLHDTANTSAPCLIIGRKGSFGKVTLSLDPAFVIDTAYFVDPDTTNENLYWLYYALSYAGLDSISKDSAVPGLSRQDAYARTLPWCPPDEQALIAKFLFWYDREVKKLIRNKRRLIALLNEEKQAIIQQAVTRGLDPDAPMKPSGLEWLGEIPAHWEVKRNGAIFDLQKEVGRIELPILEVSLHTGVTIRDFENSKRKQMMADLADYQTASRGDLAYNMMRMWQGAVGVVPTDGLVSPAYVVVRPRPGTVSAYFAFLYRTNPYMQEVDAFSRGIVKDRNRLYWTDFKQMPVLIPPRDEQASIVYWLEGQHRSIHSAIARVNREIDLIREYRTRLIADVVTGQLDVRDVQFDDADSDSEDLREVEAEMFEDELDSDDFAEEVEAAESIA